VSAPASVYATMYCEIGMSLTYTWPGSKGPRHPGWNVPANAITSPAAALRYWTDHPAHGIAALLGDSGLVSLDIDDIERSALVLAHFGVDLDELRATAPCIIGRHFRLMYRAPEVELKHRTLAWPRQDGKPGGDVLLEFRAGSIADALPPTRHASTGLPYRWKRSPTDGFPPLPDCVLDLWTHWENTQRIGRALCPWAPALRKAAPSTPRTTPFTGTSVIDHFNLAHSIDAVLETHGYQRRGKRFTAPDSQHSAGIAVLDDGRVFCHHQGDPLATGHALDSFDLYRLLEHQGSYSAAVKAAAAALGLDQRATR
jgi:putative DNA primase/helicase